MSTGNLEKLADLIAAKLLDGLAERVAAWIAVENERLLTPEDLAERIVCTRRGIYHMTDRGELHPGHLIGGLRRWRWSEVLAHLAARQARRRRKGRGIRHQGPD